MNRIIRVSQNNVEVTPSKEMTDINGKTFTVWDEANKQHYGQDRIDSEVLGNTAEKDSINAFDPVKDKADKLTANQEIKDTLTLIQEKMDE